MKTGRPVGTARFFVSLYSINPRGTILAIRASKLVDKYSSFHVLTGTWKVSILSLFQMPI
jgi:hypothetical protein